MNARFPGTPADEHGTAAHDEPYTWGLAPNMYLAQRQIARLMVFRSRLENRPTLRNRVNRLTVRTARNESS
jgi:hypothetical protein